jgi:predicted transcriptional regulator
MSIHVAILKPTYARMILDGKKTVESRLTRTAQPPYRAIESGERIFIKASAGPFMATAIAGLIEQHQGLEPRDIQRLHRHHNNAVCGDDAYWELKENSRFAVFIHLTQVEPIEVGPAYNKSMRAWHVLDESLSPLMDISLTDGAIRNRYLSLPGVSQKMRSRPVTLLMPDGQEIVTGFADGKPRLRWRGWGSYYDEYRLLSGDTVRLIALQGGLYRVEFRHTTKRS